MDQEYPSLDSVPSDNSLTGPTTFSPRNSEPPSLTESMQLMDEILSDKTMDRIERIDKLEAILSAATLLPSDPVSDFYVFYFCSTDRKLIIFKICVDSHFQVITTLNNSDAQSNSSSSYSDSFQFIKTEPKRYEIIPISNHHFTNAFKFVPNVLQFDNFSHLDAVHAIVRAIEFKSTINVIWITVQAATTTTWSHRHRFPSKIQM